MVVKVNHRLVAQFLANISAKINITGQCLLKFQVKKSDGFYRIQRAVQI